MWLERITMKDFRCFYGEQAIEFSTEAEKNVTVVHAENGVGKTTLLNALLWCFYGMTTARFEKREDLINYDALAEGRTSAYVEVLFEHNDNRYRARRYSLSDTESRDYREFSIMRLDSGHSVNLDTPDTFINTVIPRGMASHFLFDGEHAEVFLGEDNRSRIRRAVQDILGCTLVDTAIKDLGETATYYRKQMPRSSANTADVSSRIDVLTSQIDVAKEARDRLKGDIEIIEQQIADIEESLRNSTAAKVLQAQRDEAQRALGRSMKREADAQDEVLRWLGDNGRFLVSTRITEQTFEHLNTQETKGRIPSPYNEEFVKDLLEMERCICGAPLKPGSDAHANVASMVQKAANATLRSRLSSIRARLTQLKDERARAPGKLDASMQRLAAARQDISHHESQLAEISAKLSGINFDEIAERETKRNELRKSANEHREKIGTINHNIEAAEADKANAERELKRLAENDSDARVFIKRYSFCEALKTRLEKELLEEEKDAQSVLRASIRKVLDETSRKAFRLHMTDDYSISLVNEAGTQLPKSGGENQLLGLAFTAALVEFARVRQNAQDYRLLKGTVAPLVLDSPFGQLDEEYRKTTAQYVPRMASQVVLMLSKSQAAGGAISALQDRVGEEYVLVRKNKDARGARPREVRQFRGKDVEMAVFDASFDGSTIVRLT
jgi:DNA sulfur modification protein DndD